MQLELGILYYKLGAYDVARAYFEQALANPSVPPNVAEQIRLYLSQLALAADPPAFSASIFSAIRWESNANAGPGTQNVTLNGINFTLDQQSVGHEGWSALNIGTLHYSYDLKPKATASSSMRSPTAPPISSRSFRTSTSISSRPRWDRASI